MNDLKYCVIRDADDEWHLECRFKDGEKFAAVIIDKKVPLAEKLTKLFAYILNNYDLKCSEISDTEADVTVYDLVDDFMELKEDAEIIESNAHDYRDALVKIRDILKKYQLRVDMKTIIASPLDDCCEISEIVNEVISEDE